MDANRELVILKAITIARILDSGSLWSGMKPPDTPDCLVEKINWLLPKDGTVTPEELIELNLKLICEVHDGFIIPRSKALTMPLRVSCGDCT